MIFGNELSQARFVRVSAGNDDDNWSYDTHRINSPSLWAGTLVVPGSQMGSCLLALLSAGMGVSARSSFCHHSEVVLSGRLPFMSSSSFISAGCYLFYSLAVIWGSQEGLEINVSLSSSMLGWKCTRSRQVLDGGMGPCDLMARAPHMVAWQWGCSQDLGFLFLSFLKVPVWKIYIR